MKSLLLSLATVLVLSGCSATRTGVIRGAPVPEIPSLAVSGGAIDTNSAPTTYPRTVVWSPPAGAVSYFLSVGAYSTNLTGTNALVPMLEGTNAILCVASNATGGWAKATTNYLIRPITVVAPEIQSSASILGPWTATNLPSAITNPPAGAPVFFRIAIPNPNRIEEHHVQ